MVVQDSVSAKAILPSSLPVRSDGCGGATEMCANWHPVLDRVFRLANVRRCWKASIGRELHLQAQQPAMDSVNPPADVRRAEYRRDLVRTLTVGRSMKR
jgi:CO/xanthine dehydrogenase FAD-binding subunit